MQEPIAGLQAKKSEGAVACTLWLKKRDWLHERSSSSYLIFEDSLLRNKVAPLIRSDPSTARLPDSGKLLATWLAAA
jgi:hypothetical protein